MRRRRIHEYVKLVLKSALQDESRHIIHFFLLQVENFRFLKSNFTGCLYFAERKKYYYDKAKQMPDYFSEGSILSENIFWKLFFSLAALLSNQRD